MNKTRAYLQLLRTPSLFTAVSNFWAGAFVSSNGSPQASVLLTGAVSAASLYGGGVALNDYADRKKDEKLRPERPIPSGRITPRSALSLSIVLLLVGTLCGLTVSFPTFFALAGVALSAVLYDTLLKNWLITAIISMSLCRALNWTAGLLSITPLKTHTLIYPTLIFAYTATLTVIARSKTKTSAKILTLCIVLFPVIDGTIVAVEGHLLQGLCVASLLIPAAVLLKLFRVD